MEPAGGRAADARAAAIRAFREAREAGDAERMAEAALKLPFGQHFGKHPGQIPRWSARRTSPGVPFADQAVSLADRTGDPVVLADALDAALLSRWGPDDFTERLRLSVRLADTAAHLTATEPRLSAHLTATEPRLSAHLWRPTTARECLDVTAVQRQLRALDVLAGETGPPRVAFFAGARRARSCGFSTADGRSLP
jgi:hypothetical protein